MNRAFRYCVALTGTFAALYLVGLLFSPIVVDVVEWVTPIRPDGGEQIIALAAAALGTVPFATRYTSGPYSLERLWTFVIATHLLAYLLVLPYFHVVDTGAHSAALRLGSPGSVAYYSMGYGLVVLAVALSYLLVYREGYTFVTDRLGN